MKRKITFIGLLLLLLAAVAVRSASASVHWAIINGLDVSRKDTATLALASDSPSAVIFTAFPPGGDPNDVATVDLDGNGFALSPDLLPAANYSTSLARAYSLIPSGSAAVLRQQVDGSEILLEVPPAEKGLGREFRIAVSDLGRGAWLLIGNPSGNIIGVDIIFTGNNLETFHLDIGAFRVATFEIPSTRANSHIGVRSPIGDVLIYLVVDFGKKKVVETICAPLSP